MTFDLWLPGITMVAPSPSPMSLNAMSTLTWPQWNRPSWYLNWQRVTRNWPPECSPIACPGPRIEAKFSSMKQGPCCESKLPLSDPMKWITFPIHDG